VIRGAYLESLDESTRLRLSGRTRTATDEGRDPLTITNENWVALAASAIAPRTMSAYYDQLLILLASRCKYPGAIAENVSLCELAAQLFLPVKAYIALLSELNDAGAVRLLGGVTFGMTRVSCEIAQHGWRRVDELTRNSPKGNRAFVAMSFDPTMDEVYSQGFERALLECGYVPPFRVDDAKHQERANEPDFKNKIDDRILAELRGATLVIADATGTRPNVYYEAGFADGLGTPVIRTCNVDHADKIAFDTRQYEHLLWTDAADLKEQLITRIRARGWVRS
jgi:nucleoside 2-deoxyribosyltransferase